VYTRRGPGRDRGRGLESSQGERRWPAVGGLRWPAAAGCPGGFRPHRRQDRAAPPATAGDTKPGCAGL